MMTQRKHILVPVDIEKAGASLDALRFVDGVGSQADIAVTLLHVVNLNILSPEQRVYVELCRASEWRLRKFAKMFIREEQPVEFCVRVGEPCREILAEAKSGGAELIVLSGRTKPFWKGLLGSGTVERVVREALCPTLVLPRVWRNANGPSRRQETNRFVARFETSDWGWNAYGVDA